jgi:hypothetical protein
MAIWYSTDENIVVWDIKIHNAEEPLKIKDVMEFFRLASEYDLPITVKQTTIRESNDKRLNGTIL